jgi:outer membrane protein OmpA-like peptidoglycan-associated protein
MKNPFERRNRRRSEPRDQDYWLSYSDVMAGLLMVFVLLLLVAAARFNEAGRELDQVKGAVIGMVQTMAVRDSIIRDLQQVSSGRLITIDTVTAAIRLSDSSAVLFEQDDDRLRPEGRAIVSQLAQDYLPVVVRNDRYRNHLREIVVEGHTNDDGSFRYNMDLSQRRAYAVLRHFFQESGEQDRALLERYLTARGRSYSEVICVDGSTAFPADCLDGVDKVRSRRIEVLFRLDDEEVVREVRTLLEARWRE